MPNATPSLDTIFCEAIEIGAAADRAAYLAQACRGDDAFRQRIEALVAAHFRAGSFLDRPADTPDATAAFAQTTAEPGTAIGPYKLLQRLGEGGMGTVYMAEQLEPVRRRVALKIIKAGMDSAHVIARFEQERQALALMDHPHIAKVLDAGATAGGRPYFVMELVKGVPITKYCDHEHLTPKERLELFVPVCQAVQHAHQKGIIHRDLKPSNVLIALYDGQPVPKVIDFGVAKATGRNLTEKTMFTEVGQVIGTLEYMAPEQAELNNLDIDTRADIYSLGVLLYELLTGSTPFTRQQLQSAAFTEMLRMIRDAEPSKPSTKLSSSEDLPSIADKRKLEPARLCKLVTGELDWIVMKALEKDRGRRYETANGLARDIQRYLADEVVEARPPSTGYRLKKFVRRNKVQVIAASLVLFVLLAGITGTTVGLIRANRAAEAERVAKLDAEAKEAEANAVVQFFEEQVFAAARPKGQDGGLGAAVTLRDAIVASLPALAKGFENQPLVEAQLRRELGITFSYLGEHEQARDQQERACILFTRHRGPDHPSTLMSMNILACSYEDLNRPADALKLNEEVLAIRQRVLPKDHPDTLTSIHNLASSYYALNRPADALKLNEEVLAIRQRVLPQDHPDTLKSMNNLALCYADLNRPADALKLNEEVLAIRQRVLPKDHPETLASMNNLANSYYALNRPADALKLREEVLAIQKRVLPQNHPETLSSMNNLANSYAALNRLADALKLYEETLAIRQRVLPKDHADTLRSMNNLGSSYYALNRHEEALKLIEEVLAIQKRVLPKDHPDTLMSMRNLANSYAALKRPADALKLREETLAIQMRVLPQDHPETLRSMYNLALSLIQLDRGTEAIPFLDEFIAKARTRPALDPPKFIPPAVSLRLRHFQRVGDPAGCRATAAMWEKLNSMDADSLYDAACNRAVTAGVQAKTPGADAARLAKEDADRAMVSLILACAAGYQNAAHMKKDKDLDSLREREDFKKLIAELEKKAEKPPEIAPPLREKK